MLEFGLRLDEAALRSSAAELRAVAEGFAHEHALLTAGMGAEAWTGTGAEAFTAVWHSLAGHLGSGAEPATICGRLAATASYVDDLAAWAAGLRGELAEAVARVATSAEAVVLLGGSPAPVGGHPPVAMVEAAARIGERFLQPAADALAGAEELRARRSGALAELRYVPPEVPSGAPGGITRAQL